MSQLAITQSGHFEFALEVRQLLPIGLKFYHSVDSLFKCGSNALSSSLAHMEARKSVVECCLKLCPFLLWGQVTLYVGQLYLLADTQLVVNLFLLTDSS